MLCNPNFCYIYILLFYGPCDVFVSVTQSLFLVILTKRKNEVKNNTHLSTSCIIPKKKKKNPRILKTLLYCDMTVFFQLNAAADTYSNCVSFQLSEIYKSIVQLFYVKQLASYMLCSPHPNSGTPPTSLVGKKKPVNLPDLLNNTVHTPPHLPFFNSDKTFKRSLKQLIGVSLYDSITG